jgi:hypothetical protein
MQDMPVINENEDLIKMKNVDEFVQKSKMSRK